jgi:hypothetical protein
MLDKVRKAIIALALLGAVAAGASAIAGAASNSGTTGATGATGSQSNQGPGGQPGTPPLASRHGPGETLLTDGTASKVRQAALAKVPGATVIRVETDTGGSPYEAHLQKSDGSQVTVKVDKGFNATAVQNGFGSGPGGPPPAGSY